MRLGIKSTERRAARSSLGFRMSVVKVFSALRSAYSFITRHVVIRMLFFQY